MSGEGVSNTLASGFWLFNKLVKASSKQEIENIKHKHAPYMDNKALKYLNTLPDKQQYPGARCDRGAGDPKVFMNQHESSSSVESMNKANNPARARTAVVAVCSTHLLVQMCSMRYQAKKEEAWKWEDTRTPYGTKLRKCSKRMYNLCSYLSQRCTYVTSDFSQNATQWSFFGHKNLAYFVRSMDSF
jgi:hypothetical protein